MKLVVRKTTTAIAAFATAGVSGMFLAAPANAATETCGEVGTLVSPGICELVFTSDGVFTRTAQMTKLEVLLVGAGGNSVASPYSAPSEANPAGTNGYAAGGGGGQVKVVDFSATTGDLGVQVPVVFTPGAVTAADAFIANVNNGLPGTGGSNGLNGSGGSSGTPFVGQAFNAPSPAPYGAGGGAGSTGVGANGGAGVVVSDLVALTSLFANDDNCYGGGGGVGVNSSVPLAVPAFGGGGCGAGYVPDASATTVVAPVPNSGGGAGAVAAQLGEDLTTGADGLIVIRWNSWQALAATGGGLNATTMSIGISVLVAGIALAFAAAYARKRTAE